LAAAVLALAPGAAAGSDGSLSFVSSQSRSELNHPTYTAVSPDGANVYVDTCTHVVSFARNAGTGALTYVDSDPIPACGLHVTVSPDGRNVYVANEAGVAVFARNATGALTLVENEDGGGLGSAQGVAVSPDGANVYVSDLSGGVYTYARDPGTGALSLVEFDIPGENFCDPSDPDYNDPHVCVDPDLAGATDLDISADGENVYVPASTNDALGVFSRDAGSGALTLVEIERDGVGGADGLESATAVAVSPDGADVYVTADAFGSEPGVATFSRDPSTGAVSFQEKNGGHDFDLVEDVTISPDGQNVYVPSYGTVPRPDQLVSYARNTTTGALTFVEADANHDPGIDGLSAPWGADVAPDGRHVYVTVYPDDAIATFSRVAGPFQLAASAKKKQKVSALAARVQCSWGCVLLAHAKVTVGDHKFKSKKAKEIIPADQATTLRLEFSGRALRTIRKLLAKDQGTAAVRIEAAAEEFQQTKQLRVKLTR